MSTATIIGWLALLAGISVLSCIGGTLALYVIEGGLEGTRWLVPVMLLCGIVPPLVLAPIVFIPRIRSYALD
jgi:hypothetical protein